MCQLSAVLIVVFCVAAVVAAAVRAVGPFRRVRGQALLPLTPHACLGAPSAPPDRGSPWEPSRDCLPDEIADERVADGMREWRRSVAELDDKNKE